MRILHFGTELRVLIMVRRAEGKQKSKGWKKNKHSLFKDMFMVGTLNFILWAKWSHWKVFMQFSGGDMVAFMIEVLLLLCE